MVTIPPTLADGAPGGRRCGYRVGIGYADRVGDVTIVVGKDFGDWEEIGCG